MHPKILNRIKLEDVIAILTLSLSLAQVINIIAYDLKYEFSKFSTL